MDNKNIIIVAILIICSSISLSISIGLFMFLGNKPTKADKSKDTSDDTYDDTSDDTSKKTKTKATSKAKTKDETPKKPDNSGNTYWDCMLGNDKKGRVPINWGHTSRDGKWACNEWKKECDKKCTATFSKSQIPNDTFLIKWAKGKCLAVNDGKDENGNRIVSWDCSKDDKNQQFVLQDNQIKWANGNNKCINLSGGSLKDDTKIALWDCNKDDTNNIWDIKDSKIYIKKANSASEETPWKNCTTWGEAWEGYKHHDWCEKDVGEGYKHVSRGKWGCLEGSGRGTCQRPSKCIHVSGGNMDNGTNAILYECGKDDQNNQFTLDYL